MDGFETDRVDGAAEAPAVDGLVTAIRRTMYQRHPHHLLFSERGEIMREHIETLIVTLGNALQSSPSHVAASEPRRRRPRRARSTYVPVRRDLASARLAH